LEKGSLKVSISRHHGAGKKKKKGTISLRRKVVLGDGGASRAIAFGKKNEGALQRARLSPYFWGVQGARMGEGET